MKFTRRHARAAAAGAATAALYLAGGRAVGSRAVRGSALMILMSVAVAGAQAAQQASAVAKTTKKRLDTHVAATAGAVALNSAHGTALTSLASNVTALTSLASNVTDLTTLANAADPTFLAGMVGPMASQTTANNTIDTTAGSLSNADRVSINGLVNAVNTLQSHLKTANIEN